MENYKTKYLEILKELEYYNKIHEKNSIKATKYKNAIEELEELEEINSIDDIKDLNNIGKAMTEKLDEYIKKGKVKNLENLREKHGTSDYETYKKNEEEKKIFTKIHGIGDVMAQKLIDKNIKTIAELKERQDEEVDGKGKNKLKLLNDAQKKGLIYYEDLQHKIQREEIDKYKEIIEEEFKNLLIENNLNNTENKLEIVGSYRRKKAESGDIDVIMKFEKENLLEQFINKLKKKEIIKELLTNGEKKIMAITQLNSNDKFRRMDFLVSDPYEYAFAILYFTGSKDFNKAMRLYVLSKQLTLNEHGLYILKNKTKGDKIKEILKTEEEIFNYLKLKYIEPEKRINKHSLIVIEAEKSKETEKSKESEKSKEKKKNNNIKKQ